MTHGKKGKDMLLVIAEHGTKTKKKKETETEAKPSCGLCHKLVIAEHGTTNKKKETETEAKPSCGLLGLFGLVWVGYGWFWFGLVFVWV